MANTRKPTLGTGPDDIDIQATKADRKPRTDVVDANGKPLRQQTKAEMNEQYKRIKTKYETARAASKAAFVAAKGTQAGHSVTDSANHTRTVK